MSTRWCPECRAEYVEGIDVCADCGVALGTRPPPSPEGEGPGRGEGGEHGAGEVLVYDLSDWGSDQRGALDMRLQAEGIEHTWETGQGREIVYGYESKPAWEAGTDLAVRETDEDRVDDILDEVEFPDALEAVEDDDGEDEAVYGVMSDLYVAADRLKSDPGDLSLAGGLFDAADAARAIGAPFGIDGEVWSRVQGLATAVTEALESEASDEEVAAKAGALRDLLFSYV